MPKTKVQEGAMVASNLRDELWNDSWKTWYDIYFIELLAEPLIAKWEKFDSLTRLIVAITASSSAVAGWQLWQDQRYRLIWLLIASSASVISIFHSAFHVSSKVKYWSEAKGRCSKLRHKLQILRYRLKTEPENIKNLNKEYLTYKDSFAALDGSVSNNDLFMTKNLKNTVQIELDTKIETDGTSQIPNHE